MPLSNPTDSLGPCALLLTIEGNLTLEAYTLLLHRVQGLLQALAGDVAPGVPVRWRLEFLHPPTPEEPPL